MKAKANEAIDLFSNDEMGGILGMASPPRKEGVKTRQLTSNLVVVAGRPVWKDNNGRPKLDV